MRRLFLGLSMAALSVFVFASGSGAATSPATVLSRAGQTVTWSGSLTTSDVLGCGEVVSTGCDHAALKVRAARGAWITIRVDGPSLYVNVTSEGKAVASNGFQPASTKHTGPSEPSAVTFQQLRSGVVTYDVGVSAFTVSPQTPITYRARAQLAGKAFDRQGDCFVGLGGLDHLLDVDDGRRLHLSVRLVSEPADAAAMRAAAPGLIETYDRINVALKVSFDTMPLVGFQTYPYEAVQRAYRGVRPAGVDVVHVMTDKWAGGFADCIGGIAFRERGFSVGSLTYMAAGVVRLPLNPRAVAALIAAHEIGHQLGGQHQQASCAEAAPQQAVRPASDGWIGACTIMGPLAAQTSETFSTLERSSVRAYVRAYAGRG